MDRGRFPRGSAFFFAALSAADPTEGGGAVLVQFLDLLARQRIEGLAVTADAAERPVGRGNVQVAVRAGHAVQHRRGWQTVAGEDLPGLLVHGQQDRTGLAVQGFLLLDHEFLHLVLRDPVLDLVLPHQFFGAEHEQAVIGSHHRPHQNRQHHAPLVLVVVVLGVQVKDVFLRPLEVLPEPSPGVDPILVEGDHASGRSALGAGLRVAGVARSVVVAVNPVGAMPPTVVQESRSAEQMGVLALLLRWRRGSCVVVTSWP